MSDSQWIFGIHAVEALLQRQPSRIERIWFQAGRNDQRIGALQELAEAAGCDLEIVPRAEIERVVNGRHQGVAARVKPAAALREADLDQLLQTLDHPPLLLILDGVTDPHNLGACLRTADAAGVDAVIAPRDNSAPLNPTVRKVASGAAEVVPLFYVTNLARTMKTLQQQGIWITGTAGEADTGLFEADLKGPIALVMGAEGKGMRRLTRENCDYLVSLPMAGSVSSLNVSVAAGVCLFEAVRQRSVG